MNLIQNDAQLRAHIPNVAVTVPGEPDFIARLEPYITISEYWLYDTFTSHDIFLSICAESPDNAVRMLCSRIVVADALHRAIPSLDLVLTPNGYGIVSTTNIAPASAQRTDRLAAAVIAERDDCIGLLLPQLASLPGWPDTGQAAFFGSTLFPDLAVVDAVGEDGKPKWNKYLELHPKIAGIEDALAKDWFSHELMERLRDGTLRRSLDVKCRRVAREIKTQVVELLKGGRLSNLRLGDTVDFIRQNPDDFQDWQGSATARQFEPPLFVNSKEAKGYFF